MPVFSRHNTIFIFHGGHGSAEQGAAITEAMREAMRSLRPMHPVVVVYHDVSGLESVGNDYVRAFARLAREWGNDGTLYLAVIPKTWVRIFAKRASTLGGIETHFFKNTADATAFLHARGFHDTCAYLSEPGASAPA